MKREAFQDTEKWWIYKVPGAGWEISGPIDRESGRFTLHNFDTYAQAITDYDDGDR